MASRYNIVVELNRSITSASRTSAHVLSGRDEMMFLSEQNKIKSSISEAQLVLIGIPIIDLYHLELNRLNISSKKYHFLIGFLTMIKFK